MSEMLTQIQSLGAQLRWAAEAELPVVPPATDVLIAGMGGSGIAGDFVAALASAGRGRVAGGNGVPGAAGTGAAIAACCGRVNGGPGECDGKRRVFLYLEHQWRHRITTDDAR